MLLSVATSPVVVLGIPVKILRLFDDNVGTDVGRVELCPDLSDSFCAILALVGEGAAIGACTIAEGGGLSDDTPALGSRRLRCGGFVEDFLVLE